MIPLRELSRGVSLDLHLRAPDCSLQHRGCCGREIETQYGILNRGLLSLDILLVFDQIRHVVTDVRTRARSCSSDGPWLKKQQSVMQFDAIVGEIQHGLAGGRVNSGAVCGL